MDKLKNLEGVQDATATFWPGYLVIKKKAVFCLVGIGSPDRPPSKQCGGWWAVGRG